MDDIYQDFPLPWKNTLSCIHASNGVRVARLACPKTHKVGDVDQLAALFAAAPELLEALVQAEEMYCRYALVAGNSECGPWINKVRDLIRRARGEE